MQELGVGLVYWPALAPLFESGDAGVLELEPQTLWKKTSSSPGFAYQLNEELFESIVRLPQPKVLHGVGQPIAGTVDDPTEYVPLLRSMASRLEPAWISEHLSFNRVRQGEQVIECGFLLPPAQTPGTARIAARNLRRYAADVGYPVAFETNVNYLAPVDGHLDDGLFYAEVAQLADCGVLLDLHNLWCNERNGRQRALDAIAQMPLERVWEVHVAGGEPFDGLWLDAHSGGMHPELIALAATVVPLLPNVGALIFEVLPEHLSNIGLDGVHRQLEHLRSIWNTRRGRQIRVERAGRNDVAPTLSDEREASAWELRLMNVMNGRAMDDPFSVDRGCAVLRRLIHDARSASLARGMRFTTTALLAGLGKNAVDRLLSDHFQSSPAETFVVMECHRFARFLDDRPDVVSSVPYLAEILAFERALLAASLFGATTVVQWTADPTELIAALEAGKIPGDLPRLASRMTITA
jgi:uncharacterized protein (UPF0276 family)